MSEQAVCTAGVSRVGYVGRGRSAIETGITTGRKCGALREPGLELCAPHAKAFGYVRCPHCSAWLAPIHSSRAMGGFGSGYTTVTVSATCSCGTSASDQANREAAALLEDIERRNKG